MAHNVFTIRNLLAFFLFTFVVVCAEEEIEPYLSSECDALSLIDGVVNAYNGKFVQIDRDIEIRGPDPLDLTRYYDGAHQYLGEYGCSVGLGYPLELRFDPKSKKKNLCVDYHRLGAKILCTVTKCKKSKSKDSKEEWYSGRVDPDFFELGYINNCQAQLNGEPALYSMKVEGNLSYFDVYLGDGSKRHYQHYGSKNKVHYYRLVHEERPNGNRRYYEYSGDSLCLSKIRTTNNSGNLTLNWITFSYEPGKMRAEASNGQKVCYDFQIVNRITLGRGAVLIALLTKATGPHLSDIEYTLSPTKHAYYAMERITNPQGRYLSAAYNSQDEIKHLYVSEEENPIYTFDYHSNHTDVENAIGANKRYSFKKRRPVSVIEDHRCSHYQWNEIGELIEETISYPSEKEHTKKKYQYDKKGNISSITVYGSITNKDAADCYTTSYIHSDDGRNLLLKEYHNEEIEYHFSYHPNTNLPASKLTVVNGQIIERKFYQYDQNAILISKIIDDGSHSDSNNLENVTYRKITEIEPQLNPSLPGFTLPHIIRDCYQDPVTGQRHLLNRKECIYSHGDLLTEEKVYDSQNVYCFSRTWKYNEKMELISETNALGETTIYSYDANGNRIFEEKVGSDKKVHKIYNVANLLMEEREEHPHITLSTHHTYDPIGNKTSTTDSFGQTTTYQYDKISREVKRTDPLGFSEHKQYDIQGNVTQAVDKDGYTTITSYNLYGSPLVKKYPDGTKKRNSYNLRGHLIEEWNRDGTRVSHQVDSQGRPLVSTTYGSDGSTLKTTQNMYKGDNLIAEIDAMGSGTTYQYDGAGRQIAKIEGSIITRYSYDTLGRLSKTTKGDRVDIKEYDFLDRVIEERTENVAGTIYSKVQYVYDIHGNRQTTREYADCQNYSETKTLYNSENLPIKEIDACGNETNIFYHRTDHLEKEIIDPLGRRTLEVYNSLNHLQELKIFSPLGVLQAHTSFTYDGRGNKTHQHEEIICNGTSIGTFMIDTAYDGMGQKSTETEQGSKTTQFTYNLGRLHTIMKPDGVTLTHQYDSLGRLQNLVSSDGTINYHYDYDLNDNILNAHDQVNGSVTTRAYDYLNRIIHEKLGSGYISLYTYDEQNRMKEMVFYGIHVVYDYSPARLVAASRYQEESRLYTYTQKHDGMGKIVEAVLPNQTTLTYTWDKLGRCTQIQSPVYSQSLVYDAVGNLTLTSVQDSMGRTHASFQYDDLDQMVQESGPFANSYNYDSIHNLHIKNQTPRSIDGLNQLTYDGANIYQYDPNGRRIAKGNAKYTYDALGRLLSYTNENTHITYIYDPFGRRLRRTTSECMRDYIYQIDTEIGVIVDNKLREFRMIVGKNAPVSMEFEDAFFYPIRNHRGDVCQLLDPNGVPTAVYRYDAFSLFTHSGEVQSPWLFSGQRYDQITSLYHYDKREYDPNVGRWLTPDPLGFVDGPNLYAYVLNNPLIYVDPYGLWMLNSTDIYKTCTNCYYGIRDFHEGIGHGGIEGVTWGTYRLDNSYRPESSAELWGYRFGYVTGAAAAGAALALSAPEAVAAGAALGVFRGAALGRFGLGILGFGRTAATTARVANPLQQAQSITTMTSQGAQTVAKNSTAATKFLVNVRNQIWSSTKDKTSVQNAYFHWSKHQKEFPELCNVNQYVEKAYELFKNSGTILTKTRQNGDILRYDPVTNTFGSFTKNGVPKTMFRPHDGNAYWVRQK